MSGAGKSIETKIRSVVAKGQGKWGVIANSYGFSLLCENALGLHSGDGYITL